MKVAVIVKMGAGDAADDADDRKVMADDDDGVRRIVARGDLIQPEPSAFGDIGQALAAGHLQLGWLIAPAGEKIAVVLLDLVEGQPFQMAMVEFANACLDHHRKFVMFADDFSGPPRPLQVAGIDTMNLFLAQSRGERFGLTQPDVAQIAIARTLAAVFEIPIGCAMAHKNDLHVGIP